MKRAMLLGILLAATAHADDAAPVAVSGGLAPSAQLHNDAATAQLFWALAPALDLGYRPDATDRDRWVYGAGGSRATLGIYATYGQVSGLVFAGLGSSPQGQSSLDLETALVRWKPTKLLTLSAGRDRVPVSVQSATPTPALVFPSRVPLDGEFALKAQAGVQAELSHEYVTARVGVWNGISSDISGAMPVPEQGLLTSALVTVTPLGKLDIDENAGRGPLRIGIGGAIAYRASSSYLPDGMTASRARDLRASFAVRVGYKGLYGEAEVLRRQITDDLSMRPDVATGAYIQGGWRFRAGKASFAPLLRLGTLAVRQRSAPARGGSFELGLAALPLASDRLRVVGLYQYLVDPDLGASHRGLAQLRLAF
jgi:hypothetical protein